MGHIQHMNIQTFVWACGAHALTSMCERVSVQKTNLYIKR